MTDPTPPVEVPVWFYLLMGATGIVALLCLTGFVAFLLHCAVRIAAWGWSLV